MQSWVGDCAHDSQLNKLELYLSQLYDANYKDVR